VYIGSYIYVDKRAPRHLRASAQSLIAFLMLGVGMLLGRRVCGVTLAQYRGAVTTMEAAKATDGEPEVDKNAPIPSWSDLAALDTDKDGRISRSEVAALGAKGLTIGKFTYSRRSWGGPPEGRRLEGNPHPRGLPLRRSRRHRRDSARLDQGQGPSLGSILALAGPGRGDDRHRLLVRDSRHAGAARTALPEPEAAKEPEPQPPPDFPPAPPQSPPAGESPGEPPPPQPS